MNEETTFRLTIQQGETVTSFTNRALPHVSPERQKRFLATQGHLRGKMSWIFPKNLSEVARIFGIRKTGQQLMQDHSVSPLHMAFLNADTAGELATRVVTGGDTDFQPSYLAGHHGRLWGLAICPTCVTEDKSKVGTHILRRTNLFPTLSVCHKHGDPLLEACRNCAWGHRHTRAPFLDAHRCLCGGPLRPRHEGLTAGDIERDMRLGKAIRGLMDFDVKEPLSQSLAVGLQRSAAEHGLLRCESHTKSLREFLNDVLGADFLQRHSVHIGETKSEFYTRLRRADPIRNPIVGSVMVLALLKDVQHTTSVSNKALHPEELSQPTVRVSTSRCDYVEFARKHGFVLLDGRSYSIQEFTNHCRGLLARRMAKVPDELRSVTLNGLATHVRKWLLTYDSEHLDLVLPRYEFKADGTDTKTIAAWSRRDNSLSNYMEERHSLLLQAQGQHYFRVSARLLVAGHPGESVIDWENDPIPKAKAARARLEETWPQFRVRALAKLWADEGRPPEDLQKLPTLGEDEVWRELVKAWRRNGATA